MIKLLINLWNKSQQKITLKYMILPQKLPTAIYSCTNVMCAMYIAIYILFVQEQLNSGHAHEVIRCTLDAVRMEEIEVCYHDINQCRN